VLIEWATEADFTPQQLAEFEEVECIFSKGRNNRYEEVEEALNSGFNADTLDKFGNTMLMIACQNGLKRIAKLVLRHGGSMNIGNKRGQTALHYCFQYGYEALGEYLITKGADPSVCNEFGLSCRQGTGR